MILWPLLCGVWNRIEERDLSCIDNEIQDCSQLEELCLLEKQRQTQEWVMVSLIDIDIYFAFIITHHYHDNNKHQPHNNNLLYDHNLIILIKIDHTNMISLENSNRIRPGTVWLSDPCFSFSYVCPPLSPKNWNHTSTHVDNGNSFPFIQDTSSSNITGNIRSSHGLVVIFSPFIQHTEHHIRQGPGGYLHNCPTFRDTCTSNQQSTQ